MTKTEQIFGTALAISLYPAEMTRNTPETRHTSKRKRVSAYFILISIPIPPQVFFYSALHEENQTVHARRMFTPPVFQL